MKIFSNTQRLCAVLLLFSTSVLSAEADESAARNLVGYEQASKQLIKLVVARHLVNHHRTFTPTSDQVLTSYAVSAALVAGFLYALPAKLRPLQIVAACYEGITGLTHLIRDLRPEKDQLFTAFVPPGISTLLARVLRTMGDRAMHSFQLSAEPPQSLADLAINDIAYGEDRSKSLVDIRSSFISLRKELLSRGLHRYLYLAGPTFSDLFYDLELLVNRPQSVDELSYQKFFAFPRVALHFVLEDVDL